METDMKYLVSLLVLFTVAASAQELPSADSYAVNFDRNAVRTNTGRRLTAITLSGNTLTIPNPMCMYVDLTPQLFTAQPGQTLMPSVAFTGTWMQTYIYIDLNQNGRFDVQEPGPQGQLGADNELVSFAGMGLADGNYNSAGQKLANLSDVQPPAFTLPANISPGFYMMRWKIDWNDCDPGGRVDEQNSIIKNGGVIVDVLLRVTDEATEGYQLIFADEFDLPNGSRPDPGKWRSSTRRGSTWNRWISDAEEVAFLQDGNLVCRAIPNPDTSTDNVPMLTGAIETRGLFSFTYGKVEVRLQVDPYTGSFPAAWMMPQPPCEVWPNSGEIDIFESVDAKNTAFHTIHSHWSYDLGHKNDPKSSFSENVNIAQWHIYGVEWLENILIFTVDGNVVGTYARSNDEDILAQGQWPFTHPFYLILNQSVGNGSWAKNPDTSHTYETRFDYIRVYQKSSVDDAVRDMPLQPIIQHQNTAAYYDLLGRPYPATARLRPGIYIRDGKKIVIN